MLRYALFDPPFRLRAVPLSALVEADETGVPSVLSVAAVAVVAEVVVVDVGRAAAAFFLDSCLRLTTMSRRPVSYRAWSWDRSRQKHQGLSQQTQVDAEGTRPSSAVRYRRNDTSANHSFDRAQTTMKFCTYQDEERSEQHRCRQQQGRE